MRGMANEKHEVINNKYINYKELLTTNLISIQNSSYLLPESDLVGGPGRAGVGEVDPEGIISKKK